MVGIYIPGPESEFCIHIYVIFQNSSLLSAIVKISYVIKKNKNSNSVLIVRYSIHLLRNDYYCSMIKLEE